MRPVVISPGTVDDLADVLRTALQDASWSVGTSGVWAQAFKAGVELPAQGWKLHISATAQNAAEVLLRCAPVLAAEQCAFKVARSTSAVVDLTGPHADRAQAGKVITIYPADDATFLRLTDALVGVTAGLVGPRILTDRAVRAGGIVHYRYGAFTGVPVFTSNGMLTAGLRTPDGLIVADRREPCFTPPDWVSDPLQAPQPKPQGSGLLAGRYAVSGAIRHATRGGVFRARDTIESRAVVIKQGRSHIGVGTSGEDSRARLKREAEILQVLHDVSGLPRLVDVFEQEGDLFLVENDLGGQSLSAWVATETHLDPRRVLKVLVELAALVTTLHDRGVVLRDLSPNNVLVGDCDTVSLVDLETLLLPGSDDALGRGATRAYVASEEEARGSTASDVFALGAIAAFAFTGEHPLCDDQLPTVVAWLSVAGRRLRLPIGLGREIAAMCHPQPKHRPTAAEVHASVSRLLDSSVRTPTARRAVRAALVPTHAPLAGSDLDQAIDRLTGAVLAAVDVSDPRSAVQSSSVGLRTAPTNVHHGSAGVLIALARHHQQTEDDRVQVALAELAHWTTRRVAALPAGLPVGMSFGAGGTAYAVGLAGQALGDPDLISWATNAALGLAADQRFTDVTHGAAGLGLALLDLWDRTGDPRLAERVADIADRLVSDAVRDSRGVGWLTGGDSRTIGFGHGLAGVSTFLAEAAGRFGHAGWAGVADEAVNTLVGEAVIVEDCARWRLDFSDRPTTASWWCHGTGGVVIPLVRAPHGVVDEELLRACGQALVADRWQVGLSYCHGLAGSAEALLDLDEALPGQGWGFRAAELLALAWTRRTNGARGELILGDPVVGSVPDFGVGHSGLLTVLLRLRHGGTRALLPTGNLR